MSNIAFCFFCHSGKTVIAFRKQWYNARVTPLDPQITPLFIRSFLLHWLYSINMGYKLQALISNIFKENNVHNSYLNTY